MIGEKGADLVKALWLQDENTIRYERDAEKTKPLSKKDDDAANKKSTNKKLKATANKKVNVFATNATAA